MKALSSRPRREQGFALAETLVAAAIIAAALGVTYDAIETSAHATARLREQRTASLVATSILSRVGADIALSPGAVDGGSDGYAWHLEVEPYDATNAAAGQGRLFEVTVEVSAGDGGARLVQLRTLRLQS